MQSAQTHLASLFFFFLPSLDAYAFFSPSQPDFFPANPETFFLLKVLSCLSLYSTFSRKEFFLFLFFFCAVASGRREFEPRDWHSSNHFLLLLFSSSSFSSSCSSSSSSFSSSCFSSSFSSSFSFSCSSCSSSSSISEIIGTHMRFHRTCINRLIGPHTTNGDVWCGCSTSKMCTSAVRMWHFFYFSTGMSVMCFINVSYMGAKTGEVIIKYLKSCYVWNMSDMFRREKGHVWRSGRMRLWRVVQTRSSLFGVFRRRHSWSFFPPTPRSVLPDGPKRSQIWSFFSRFTEA